MKESGKMRLKSTIYESTRAPLTRSPSPMGKANRWRLPRDTSTQVAAVLAFVISHTTFLVAQDDETGRCSKVVGIAIRGNAFPTYGGANPVSLRQAASSRERGENVGRFECIYPSFLWKEVPAGRRLGDASRQFI